MRRSHVVRLPDPKDDPASTLTADHTLSAILSAYDILELACLPEGALLRGWGATALLKEVAHVVRVRITALAREARFEETAVSRKKLASLMTEAHIKALLKLHPSTHDLTIEVAAEGHIVRLAGQVASDDLKARCELVAWRVPGIEGVQNALAVAA